MVKFEHLCSLENYIFRLNSKLMSGDQESAQPQLFDVSTRDEVGERVILYALGEFQSRGFRLIDRELPLDRLRGAFKRAAEQFSLAEISDEQIAEILLGLGAAVKKIPSYVAKHPYRVTIGAELAGRAAEVFESLTSKRNNL